MDEQSRLDRLLELKADLEALGCKVTILPDGEDDVITVRIVYPSDVPPEDIVIPW